jgi:hypothetical protein
MTLRAHCRASRRPRKKRLRRSPWRICGFFSIRRLHLKLSCGLFVRFLILALLLWTNWNPRSAPRVYQCAKKGSSTDGLRGDLSFGYQRNFEVGCGPAPRGIGTDWPGFLGCIPLRTISAPVANFYAAIKVTRQQLGLTMDENDLWVAATALALGATLVTRDSDFAGIHGLSIVAPE